jgi:hypothetical protein
MAMGGPGAVPLRGMTRDVPIGLGGAVKPLLREMPQESLAGMLSATVKALR